MDGIFTPSLTYWCFPQGTSKPTVAFALLTAADFPAVRAQEAAAVFLWTIGGSTQAISWHKCCYRKGRSHNWKQRLSRAPIFQTAVTIPSAYMSVRMGRQPWLGCIINIMKTYSYVFIFRWHPALSIHEIRRQVVLKTKTWVASNFLLLNSFKTGVIILGPEKLTNMMSNHILYTDSSKTLELLLMRIQCAK